VRGGVHRESAILGNPMVNIQCAVWWCKLIQGLRSSRRAEKRFEVIVREGKVSIQA
jgi:hypothetical protein